MSSAERWAARAERHIHIGTHTPISRFCNRRLLPCRRGFDCHASENRAHADATKLPNLDRRPHAPHARRSGWRVGAKAAGLVTCVALALGGQASVAAAQPWFRETDIATITPSVAGCGKTSHKPRNIGGEATAVFDVNGDGIPDIVIVNGTDYYFVALGHRNPNGTVSYPKDATPYRIGLTGDDRIAKSKALGLTDFNRDGKLDLYIGNSGNGSLDLKNPRGLANAYNPANLDTSHLCEYHGYRTYVNKGNGMFGYKNVGADVNGDTRTPLFEQYVNGPTAT